MAANFGYVATGAGIIKLVHLLFGLITLGCAFGSFDSDVFQDRLFAGCVTTIFLVSLIYLLFHCASVGIARSGANRLLNVFYHFLGAAILLAGAIMWLQFNVSNNNRYCKDMPPGFSTNSNICGKFATKATAAAFAIMNAILYLATIALTATGSGYDEEDPEIEGYNK